MRLFKRKKKDIQTLRDDVEKEMGGTLCSPRDFHRLRDAIYERTSVIIGLSTLMRMWGYVKDDGQPSKNTLDTLAHFLNYQDYTDYSHVKLEEDEPNSSPVLSHGISVPDQLCEGGRLRLTWLPDRVCDVEYLGGLRFRVVAVEHTHLQVGDTFTCSIILEGVPLTVDHLQREGMAPMIYVCGKKGGVKFTLLHNDEPPARQ